MAKVSHSFLCLNVLLVLVLLLLQYAECQQVRTLASPCGNAGKNNLFFWILSA